MDYGGVIRDAFRITWRNRFLWFFGVFAGTTGVPSFGLPSDGSVPGRGTPDAGLGVEPGVLVAILAGFVILFLVFVALSLLSQGALAESVAAIAGGEERSFGSAWRAGLATFWRVLGQLLAMAVIAIVALIAIAVPLGLLVGGVFTVTDAGAPRALVVVVAILLGLTALILVYVPIAVVSQLALREVVLGGARPIAAIRGGVELFRRNFGRGLLLFLIQLGIGLGAAIALGLALVVAGLVIGLPAILLAIAGSTTAAIVAGVVAGLILVPVLLAAFGALGAFGHAFWTLAYLRLRAGGPSAPPATGV